MCATKIFDASRRRREKKIETRRVAKERKKEISYAVMISAQRAFTPFFWLISARVRV